MYQLHSQELHDQCQILCNKSLELLKPSLAEYQNKSSMEKMIYFFKMDRVFSKIPEYENAIELMKKDRIISNHLDKLVGNSHGKSRVTAKSFLRNLLEVSLDTYLENNIFDKNLFDELYEDFESFFYNDTFAIAHKIIVGNFESDEVIKIDDNLQIRPITKREKDFFSDSRMMGMISRFHDLTHVIEHIVYEEKLIGDAESKTKRNTSNEYDVAEKVLSALRLFKKGKIMAGVFMTQTNSTIHNMGTSWSERGLRYPSHSSTYTLNDREISDFIKFWKLISDSRYHQSKSVSIAIRRFNNAYDREKNEDEIIDYLIAFEALLFKSETQELSEKLSRRVARLLETNFNNRKRLSKTIKDFYNKRSRIVHGIETEITSEYVDDIQEVLRKSIKKILEKILIQHHEDIIDHLDFD